jgi:3-deoxy-manno-octulosonate cytidylyltransferase (CMP-KDO synthetase)
MNIIGVIPARYGSTRFPGKPLHLIAGKPLIQHVIERCQQARRLSKVVVATDDTQIWEVAQHFCDVEMTRPDHPSGTDRIAEVASRLSCDAVVNIQGDEPLIDPGVIDRVASALDNCEISTAATALDDPEEYDDANVVKVVLNKNGQALYFSRRTSPFLRDAASLPAARQMAAYPFLKHLGIYGYRRAALLRLVSFPVSALEAAEKLEQLRALENGMAISVVRVDYKSIGVDTPADAQKVETLLKRGNDREFRG